MHTQSSKLTKRSLFVASLMTAAFLLQGCGGGDDGAAGPAGPAGAAGVTGATGPTGKDLTSIVKAADLSDAEWGALSLTGEITKVTISSPPVVEFKITDAEGNPVVGLGDQDSKGVYPNLLFSIAKLIPGNAATNSPSRWVSYFTFAPGQTAVPMFPEYDHNGTLKDNGNGTYSYTFFLDITKAKSYADAYTGYDANRVKADLDDLTYDPALPHRLIISAGWRKPGTTKLVKSSANLSYDFIPATGKTVTLSDPQREIVTINKCNECHSNLNLHTNLIPGMHDTKLCVVCHTEQVKFGSAESMPASGNVLVPAGIYAAYGATLRLMDRSLPNFPNMVHHIHMGDNLYYQGYNQFGTRYNKVVYPQDQRNCIKCHDGSATATNKTAQGDNWKNVPSRLACGGCHDGINFATGAGTTAAGASTGHLGGAKANDAQCVLCHDATTMPLYHADKLPSTADAAKRTMSASITKVTVGATDGSVNVTFKVTDNGVAVTDMTKFTKPSFGLVKLVPAANGEGSHWVSYTSRFRTKSATMAPVLQASNENAGTLTANADGTFNYKFALLTASTEGDIRTVTHAHNVSTIAPYAGTAWTGAGATVAGTGVNVIPYEPTLTHRVAMTFQKVGTPNIDNATNATFDFVPAGGAVTSTRNIVTMNNCATCHAGGKLHSGYATEYCVTCHNQGTFDPFTAETVDFQRQIHKIHMGADLPSVQAGGTYVINGTHDYSEARFPGVIKDCASACHKQTATKVGSTTLLENRANWETTPTSRACGACHDSSTATVHINSQINGGVETCVVCHGTTATLSVKAVHSR